MKKCTSKVYYGTAHTLVANARESMGSDSRITSGSILRDGMMGVGRYRGEWVGNDVILRRGRGMGGEDEGMGKERERRGSNRNRKWRRNRCG